MVRAGCVFVAGIHPSRTWTSGSFESVRWNACVHRLDLGLYSHPKEFWGNGIWTHVNSKGKIPSTGKFPQRRIEPSTLWTASPNTTNELFRPRMVLWQRHWKQKQAILFRILALNSNDFFKTSSVGAEQYSSQAVITTIKIKSDQYDKQKRSLRNILFSYKQVLPRIHLYWGFPTRMVYLYYIACLRYTILIGNPHIHVKYITW